MIYDVDLLADVAIYAEVPEEDIYYDSPAFNAMFPETGLFAVGAKPPAGPRTFWFQDGVAEDWDSLFASIEYWKDSLSSLDIERVGLLRPLDLGIQPDSDNINEVWPIYRLYPYEIAEGNTWVGVQSGYEYWLYAFDLGGGVNDFGDDRYINITAYRLPLWYLYERSDLAFPSYGGRNPLPPSSDGLLTWLSSFGEMVLLNNPLIALLDFKIGGYSFVYFLLTVGFTVYVTWVVVKWVIP